MRTIFNYSLCVVAFISVFGHFSVPVASASNIKYVPLAPIDAPGSEFTKTTECVAPTCFPKYLRTIYNVGIGLAGLFAVLSIVRGGFTLIFTDSILGHSEAKGIILRALGGLVIVYSSYIFMNAISPSLGSDLDLSLSFQRVDLQPENLTALNVVASYGKFLDEALAKAKLTSTKAQELKASADAIQKDLEDGNYATEAEGQALRQKYTLLRTQETEARNYENRLNDLEVKRSNMVRCLNNTGPCFEPTYGNALRQILGVRTPEQIARDRATAQQYIVAMDTSVKIDAAKLRAAGLEERAQDLEARVVQSQKIYDFTVACPLATVATVSNWKKGDKCP